MPKINKGRFTKENASAMGKRGGLKTLRKYKKKYFVALAAKRALKMYEEGLSKAGMKPLSN